MGLLLDTNAYVAFCQGKQGVIDLIAASDGVVMSTIVLGELLYGFRNGSRQKRNLESLKSFLAEPGVSILAVTLATAVRYGDISAALRTKGTPIPTNDIWIAAHAMEADAPLVSFDKHFQAVQGLDLMVPSE